MKASMVEQANDNAQTHSSNVSLQGNYLKQLLSHPSYAQTTNRIMDAYAVSEARKHGVRSVIFYTTNKCASTMMTGLFERFAQNDMYVLHDYTTVLHNLGDVVETVTEVREFITENSDQLFHEFGEFYGPIKKPVDFHGRRSFRQIFFLRDPRDVLVSMFYSYAFSHSPPPNPALREGFYRNREQLLQEGIDNYCLRQTEASVLPMYETYKKFKEEAEDSLYLSYDLYKDNPKAFLVELSAFLGVSLLPFVDLKSFVSGAEPVPTEAMNVMEHKRSGSSRQFEHELQPQTLDHLNNRLKDVLEFWGFAI